MSKRFSERILDYLRKPGYRPTKARKLAKALDISDSEFGEFYNAVDSLRKVGRIVLSAENAVSLPRAAKEITGTYRGNVRGFGFVVHDGHTDADDLFIAPGDSMDAVTGDRVRCEVVGRGERDGKKAFGGRVLEVLQRGENKFVGKLQLESGIWFVTPMATPSPCRSSSAIPPPKAHAPAIRSSSKSSNTPPMASLQVA